MLGTPVAAPLVLYMATYSYGLEQLPSSQSWPSWRQCEKCATSLWNRTDLSCRAPTAGGQYHWVSMLAPSSIRNFMSYIMGAHSWKKNFIQRRANNIRLVGHMWMASNSCWRWLSFRYHDRNADSIESRRLCTPFVARNLTFLGYGCSRCVHQHGHQQCVAQD